MCSGFKRSEISIRNFSFTFNINLLDSLKYLRVLAFSTYYFRIDHKSKFKCRSDQNREGNRKSLESIKSNRRKTACSTTYALKNAPEFNEIFMRMEILRFFGPEETLFCVTQPIHKLCVRSGIMPIIDWMPFIYDIEQLLNVSCEIGLINPYMLKQTNCASVHTNTHIPFLVYVFVKCYCFYLACSSESSTFFCIVTIYHTTSMYTDCAVHTHNRYLFEKCTECSSKNVIYFGV